MDNANLDVSSGRPLLYDYYWLEDDTVTVTAVFIRSSRCTATLRQTFTSLY